MRLVAILCALTLSTAALAQGQPAAEQRGPPAMQRMRQRFEKKVRMMRLLEVAEALDLSDAEALRFDQVMRKYDAKKQGYVQQIGEGVRVLRQASRGDASQFGQVNGTIDRLLDARAKIQAIDRQMYDELAKGLSPQRRAKLALVLARGHARSRPAGEARLPRRVAAWRGPRGATPGPRRRRMTSPSPAGRGSG